jgi:O-antigen/teichoic acid export membrane protein
VGLIFAGLRWSAPLVGLAAGMALAVALVWRRDWRDVAIKIDRAALRRVAQYGLPLSLTVALTVVISTSDRFLIAWRLDEAAAGLYSVAVDFASQTLTMLLMVVYMAAFPLAVRAWEQGGRDAATRQMRSNASLLMALGVPAAIGLAVLAPGFARCFLGTEFRSTAARIMPLVALGSLLAGLKAYHFDAAFQFAHRTIHQVWIVLGAAVLNVALNWFAIPRYGINGAAGASVLAYAVSIVVTAAFGRRYFAVPFPPRTVAQVTIGGAAMAAVLWPLRGHLAPVALAGQVVLGAAVYGAVLLSLNFLHLRDYLVERVSARKAEPVVQPPVAHAGTVELLKGGAS